MRLFFAGVGLAMESARRADEFMLELIERGRLKESGAAGYLEKIRGRVRGEGADLLEVFREIATENAEQYGLASASRAEGLKRALADMESKARSLPGYEGITGSDAEEAIRAFGAGGNE